MLSVHFSPTNFSLPSQLPSSAFREAGAEAFDKRAKANKNSVSISICNSKHHLLRLLHRVRRGGDACLLVQNYFIPQDADSMRFDSTLHQLFDSILDIVHEVIAHSV